MTNPNHTDTSRSGDLVERLREDDYNWHNGACLEAADRLEALEAKVKGLRDTLQRIRDTGDAALEPAWVKRIVRAALGEKP